jgi:hypothetical protein
MGQLVAGIMYGSEEIDKIHDALTIIGIPTADERRPLSALKRVKMLAVRCQSMAEQLGRAKHDVEHTVDMCRRAEKRLENAEGALDRLTHDYTPEERDKLLERWRLTSPEIQEKTLLKLLDEKAVREGKT